MDATNKDLTFGVNHVGVLRTETAQRSSTWWHPAAGGSLVALRARRDTPGVDAVVVDLATERAIRLLIQAGMIAPTTVPRRRGTVR
jgi:hypothetical protein